MFVAMRKKKFAGVVKSDKVQNRKSTTQNNYLKVAIIKKKKINAK